MDKNKIIFVIASLSGGGAEKAITLLANFYARSGMNVMLLTLDNVAINDVYPLDKSIQRVVLNLPSLVNRNKYLRLFFRVILLRRIFKTSRPCAIISFMTPTNIFTLISCFGLKLKCIISERIHPAYHSYGIIYDILRKVIYRFSYVLVVQTDDIANWYKNNLKVKIVVIPNFLQSLQYSTARVNYANENIIAIGRLDKQKGFDALIVAFSKLRDCLPSWHLFILGDGPERKILENLINEHKLNANVHLPGFVDNPVSFISKCSIGVMTSRYEGFPNALLEMMASGLACIATNESGYMLIKSNINGVLISKDSIDEISQALFSLMTNQVARKNFGNSAKMVNKHFDEASVIKKWDAILF
jgi:GalNAc-alpha-(1->4)-GalNAc-alpha-(1->3)-diNAcBac-PP-undecaprenol alpha-1,4-N-acetyl-D-galactosaminyltransferase